MIKVRNLWKCYGQLQVLRGLDLDVIEGETLVILGRSGVGKSVLLRQLIGIEKADRGSIYIDDTCISDINLLNRVELARTMGMLFQAGALFDSMTVGDNVAFYLNQHCPEMSRKEIQEAVSWALEMVGLQGIEQKMPSDLSGGMRKRAALARLIVYRPRLLLYDEPTTGLDPITAMQINELINQTKKALSDKGRKATSIVVTHDIRSALEVGDRFAFHHEGKLIYIAPPQEFFAIDDPLLRRFFANATVSPELIDQAKRGALGTG